MKKKAWFLVSAIFYFLGGGGFLLSAVLQEDTASKYGFLIAAICLLVAGLGMLYTYFNNKTR